MGSRTYKRSARSEVWVVVGVRFVCMRLLGDGTAVGMRGDAENAAAQPCCMRVDVSGICARVTVRIRVPNLARGRVRVRVRVRISAGAGAVLFAHRQDRR